VILSPSLAVKLAYLSIHAINEQLLLEYEVNIDPRLQVKDFLTWQQKQNLLIDEESIVNH
jgi:hypothetical protein